MSRTTRAMLSQGLILASCLVLSGSRSTAQEVIISDPTSVLLIVNRDSNDLTFMDLESRQIVGSVFTFATPVVPTTSVTGSNRAYIAAVQSDPSSPAWQGFLRAYDRDATDGSIRLDADGKPDSTYLAWEAGDNSNRRIPINMVLREEQRRAGKSII